MSRRKTLLLDMDGIIANFRLHTVERYNLAYGTKFSTDNIEGTLSGDHFFVDEMPYKTHLDPLWKAPGFFLYLPVIEGSQQSIKNLSEVFDIVIVTAPYENSVTGDADKRAWLDLHFPFLTKRIFTSHKYYIDGDIIVDDRVKLAEDWKERHPNGKAASIKYPWTTSETFDVIGNDWVDLERQLIKLA